MGLMVIFLCAECREAFASERAREGHVCQVLVEKGGR